MRIGLIIPTLNAEGQIAQLVRSAQAEGVVSRILVIDSASTDRTVEVAMAAGAEVVQIARGEFNHGSTREFGRKLLRTEIVVYLTQDIVPIPGYLRALTDPICQGLASVAYSRQLPHDGADFFEAFPREFNYPARSRVRTLADVKELGVFTFFCSDSCSAYSNEALGRVGGFGPILTNEDYFAVAKLLCAGCAIAYVAESRVKHSHRYTLVQEFKRYFDNGYVRAEHRWVTTLVGQAEGHGSGFFAAMVLRLLKQRPHAIPFAVLQTAVKWLGFRMGHLGPMLPLGLCQRLSAQPWFWFGKYSVRSPAYRASVVDGPPGMATIVEPKSVQAGRASVSRHSDV